MSPTVLQAVLVVLVLAFVAWRQMRARELKVSRLWIVPVLLAYESWHFMPPGLGVLALGISAVALLSGLALGVFRAGLYTIVPHPDKGTVAVKASPWALLVWGAVLLFKLGARHIDHTGAMTGHLDTLSFALLVLALGMLLGTRGRMLYVYYRLPSGNAGPVVSPADPV